MPEATLELIPPAVADLVAPEMFGTTVLALPDGLDVDQWAALGSGLRGLHTATAWWLGDWLVYAFERWTEPAERGAVMGHLAELGFDHETIDRYRRVCALFPPRLRHESLSWSHHLEVAALDLEDACDLLIAAHDNGWSTKRLREAVKAARRIELDPGPAEDEVVRAIVVRFDLAKPPAPIVAERLARGIEKTLRDLGLDGSAHVR